MALQVWRATQSPATRQTLLPRQVPPRPAHLAVPALHLLGGLPAQPRLDGLEVHIWGGGRPSWRIRHMPMPNAACPPNTPCPAPAARAPCCTHRPAHLRPPCALCRPPPLSSPPPGRGGAKDLGWLFSIKQLQAVGPAAGLRLHVSCLSSSSRPSMPATAQTGRLPSYSTLPPPRRRCPSGAPCARGTSRSRCGWCGQPGRRRWGWRL